ncbi:hypothetical protein EMIT0158MI4_130062 [Burkholderia ambifaria]
MYSLFLRSCARIGRLEIRRHRLALRTLLVQQRLILLQALVDLVERDARSLPFDRFRCARDEGRGRDEQVRQQQAHRIHRHPGHVLVDGLLREILHQHALARDRQRRRRLEVVGRRLRNHAARLRDQHVRTDRDLRRRVGRRFRVDRLHGLQRGAAWPGPARDLVWRLQRIGEPAQAVDRPRARADFRRRGDRRDIGWRRGVGFGCGVVDIARRLRRVVAAPAQKAFHIHGSGIPRVCTC